MTRRRLLVWFIPAALALAAASALGTGSVLALSGRFGERLGPPPVENLMRPRKTGAVRVVALGDSITDGTGDPQRGYAARAVEALRRRGRQISLVNLAVGGDETKDLLRRMQAPHARDEIGRASVIVLSAGGNDFSHALRPLSLSARGEGDPEAALATARKNLSEIVRQLRALNPDAPIRLIGLYNPFEIEPSEEARARAQLLEWNNAIEAATHQAADALVVPIADLFVGRPDRLAGDRFHPGARGHDLIAQRLLSTLPESD